MRFSERLRDARLLVGATQEELALGSGVSQALISMIERGDRQLGAETAESLAESLGLPVQFFDVAPSTIPDSAIDFRKLKSASVKDTNRAKVLFKEAYRVATQLMDDAGYPHPTLPLVQERSYPLEAEDLENLAMTTRQYLQLDKMSPISNVTRALERRGIAVAPLVIPGADEDMLSTVQHFGASHWASLHDHALIGYFAGASGDRDRFTASHELGHLVLHTFRQHVPTDIREDEANQFASAFLIPLLRVREALGAGTKLRDLAQLKAKWGVSMQAIIMRGKRSGAISETQASSLFRQISSRGWRKNEPVQVPHETPVLLRTLLELKYGSSPFTSDDMQKQLALPTAIVRSFAPRLNDVDQLEVRSNVRYLNFGR
jgi:Zn-dependent peptidase ImmA (M78 family)/DNA-binding XRE family transcriptional regulator